VSGSGGIAPLILGFGTWWKWVVSFTPRPLYPQGKSLRDPLDRRLGGPQNRSGGGGEEKNSQSPPGIEPLEPPIVQPLAQRYIDWAITALEPYSEPDEPSPQVHNRTSYLLTFSFHLCLGLPTGLFPSVFHLKTSRGFLSGYKSSFVFRKSRMQTLSWVK
jgi:hypothetical protein